MSAPFNHLSRCCLAVALLAAPVGCGSTEETSSGPVVPSEGPADPAVGDCPAKAPVLACGQPDLAGIAVDQENVYYGVDGAIMKVPIQGGVPVALVRLTFPAIAIAVHGGNVFWVDHDDSSMINGGSVHKVDIAGGVPVLLASDDSQPNAIAVDDESVYWLDQGAVMKVPAAGGGTPTMLAPASYPAEIAVGGANVYWTEFLGENSAPSAEDGRLMRVPINGGAAVVLASDQAHPVGVAVDSANVYWTTLGSTTGIFFAPQGNGGMSKIPIAGDTPVVPLLGGDGSFTGSAPGRIAINAEYVFWADAPSGRVNKIPIAGGAPETVSDGQGSPRELAVDMKQVYFIDQMEGTVTELDQ